MVSDSVQPHRRQPTRPRLPWDSPGKNTGVGCHFHFQCMKVKSESEVAHSGPTLSDRMDCSSPGSSIHGIFQARTREWVAISSSNAWKWKGSRSVMSDSLWPHRLQPARLLCPWDSPGKNTGVGCHFLLQCMKVKSESEITQLCPTLSDPMDCSLPGSFIHGIFQARVLEWVPLPSCVWVFHCSGLSCCRAWT